MFVYGYCRISTPQQNIERQVRNIAAAYPAAHIVREVYTGTACQGRRELDKLLRIVQEGDTIVFDSVSRMSRSADEGCALYETLYKRGVNLCFLKEPHINTDTYKQALQRQIGTAPETGSAATDRFVAGVMDALNRYTADLAAEQIRLAFGFAVGLMLIMDIFGNYPYLFPIMVTGWLAMQACSKMVTGSADLKY